MPTENTYKQTTLKNIEFENYDLKGVTLSFRLVRRLEAIV